MVISSFFSIRFRQAGNFSRLSECFAIVVAVFSNLERNALVPQTNERIYVRFQSLIRNILMIMPSQPRPGKIHNSLHFRDCVPLVSNSDLARSGLVICNALSSVRKAREHAKYGVSFLTKLIRDLCCVCRQVSLQRNTGTD